MFGVTADLQRGIKNVMLGMYRPAFFTLHHSKNDNFLLRGQEAKTKLTRTRAMAYNEWNPKV
jgi:hypothetical protein